MNYPRRRSLLCRCIFFIE